MILGLMQPYFFPYIGYFELIHRVDTWVVFDIVNFTPQSWMTRNRMLHPENGWQYVRCQINKTRDGDKIHTVTLIDAGKDCRKILGQLTHYAKVSPYYNHVVRLVKQSFAASTSDSLVDLNVSAMSAVCEYLGIHFKPIIASKAGLSLPPIEHAGQWALEISSLMGADTYINPPGGRAIFKPEEFRARGIKLAFTRLNNFVYKCPGYTFEPHLSILDVMMWNSPEEIRAAMLAQDLDYA